MLNNILALIIFLLFFTAFPFLSASPFLSAFPFFFIYSRE